MQINLECSELEKLYCSHFEFGMKIIRIIFTHILVLDHNITIQKNKFKNSNKKSYTYYRRAIIVVPYEPRLNNNHKIH